MVFVRKVRTGSGATAVQIAERVAGRDRVVEHVGSAHSQAELAALMATAWSKIHAGQDVLDLFGSSGWDPVGNRIVSKRAALLWKVLTHAYEVLGFDALGDDAFRDLVLARIIEPTSKADSVRVLDEIGVEHASLRTLFRSLARAQRDDYRGSVSARCFEYACRSGDISLVLYDVTTLYFETEKEDELRKVRYSKERRVDLQIVVGLLVDRRGFPLEIGMFEGNKAETHTLGACQFFCVSGGGYR